MSALTLPAPAKLNLFLHITGRRDDGYHSLQTVFQLLDYGDELELVSRDDGKITLLCHGPTPLSDVSASDNLVLRAAQLLRHTAAESETPKLGADIKLFKRLPTGGGLGGGSSDAASTLLGLNKLWNLNVSVDELAELGRQLGADVPVFVHGHSAWAEGIGEKITPLELPKRWFLIVHPSCHVSTKEIFSHSQLTRDTPAITMAAFFTGPTRNDLESLVRRLVDPVDKALNWLGNFGEARMTGSGASVFTIFDNEAQALAAQRRVPSEWHSFVAQGVNRSPAWEQLDTLRSG